MTNSMIGKEIICKITGKTFIGAIDGISTNYATNSKGEYFSDEGVNIAEKLELKDTSKPFFAYVSTDGQSITGWKGNKLATILRSTPCKLSRQSFTHSDKSYKSFRVVDIHGNFWHGRSSAGICITLIPYKKAVQ